MNQQGSISVPKRAASPLSQAFLVAHSLHNQQKTSGAMLGEGAAAAGGAGANSSMNSAVRASIFKRPHFAAEVQDFLCNRATPEEAQLIERFINLVQEVSGVPAFDNRPVASTHQPKPRPATTQGAFPTRHQQQQQQQLKRVSMATDADSAPALSGPHGTPSSNNTTSWLYTTTAAAAAATELRPHSAVAWQASSAPSTRHIAAAATRAKAHTDSRPGSAAVFLSPSAGPQHSPKPSALQAGRPTSSPAGPHPQGLSKASAAAAPAAAAAAAAPASPKAPVRSVNITTSQAMHGLKDLSPVLWEATVPICRPDPAPNKNFISEWGESLRQGAGEAWKPYLATTSELANQQVAKPTDESAVRADEALIGWVAKQRTHFAELLSPPAAAAVAALLEGKSTAAATAAAAAGSSSGSDASGSSGVSLADKKGMLQVVRQLAAVVQPDKDKSTSHMHHCRQVSMEEASTTALLKEQTRIKTMGFPRKVTVKGFVRPLSSSASTGAVQGASAAAAAAAGRCGINNSGASAGTVLGGRGVRSAGCCRRPTTAAAVGSAAAWVDTQKSRVPLKWAASSLVPPCSAYNAQHRPHPGRSPQMLRTKFREVNVGMGHVDQHLYPPGCQVYPVETLYLGLPAKCRPQPHDVKTTYRSSFPFAAAGSGHDAS